MKNLEKVKIIIKFKNFEDSEIFLYLDDNELACRSFMDAAEDRDKGLYYL